MEQRVSNTTAFPPERNAGPLPSEGKPPVPRTGFTAGNEGIYYLGSLIVDELRNNLTGSDVGAARFVTFGPPALPVYI